MRMTPKTSTEPLPSVPPDVLAFAGEQGVSAYITPLVEMTRRVLPHTPMTVLLDEDPEIRDLRRIVLEIDVTGLDEDQLFAGQNRWTEGLFQICPSTHAHLFVLGMR